MMVSWLSKADINFGAGARKRLRFDDGDDTEQLDQLAGPSRDQICKNAG